MIIILLLGVWDNTVQVGKPTPELANLIEYTSDKIQEYHFDRWTMAFVAFYTLNGLWRYFTDENVKR